MLVLVREKTSGYGIQGTLYLNGAIVCRTLENESYAIPMGLYSVENSLSPKFGRELPLLFNDGCKASRGIRIHKGVTKRASLGCVLVGMSFNGGSLVDYAEAERMVTMLCRNTRQLLITSA